MIIDKKGRLFGKINIIDLCVVLFVVLSVAFTAYKFTATPGSSDTVSKASIEYTLKVKNVRNFTARQFAEGDSLYDDESGQYLGKISKVRVEDAVDFALNTDGNFTMTTRPERYDVYVTLVTDGTINNSGYFAGGIRQISPYGTVIVSNKRVKTTTTVEEVGRIN